MINKIKNFIFGFIYVFVIIYLLIYFPSLWGYKPLVVVSGSMEPTLKIGSILYYHELNLDEFEPNDILVYQTKEHIISHRIVNKTETGFITKGDANNSIDQNVINKNQILGIGTNWCIPYLGYYADFIYNHKIILYVSMIIIVIDIAFDYFKIKRGDKK